MKTPINQHSRTCPAGKNAFCLHTGRIESGKLAEIKDETEK